MAPALFAPARLRRARLPLALLTLAVLACACGREAPSFEPGQLTVTSTPPGAAILIDGVDTGHVTPHTFDALDADLYDVSVRLDGWVAAPASRPVDLRPLDRRTVDFSLSQTGLMVTSNPPGARISVDGTDTGLLTPATVAGLAPGEVEITLALDTYLVFPAAYTATVIAGQVTELPADTFTLRPRRTVMLEGFANVDCGPCPQLTANLLSLTGLPAYGPDRVLFLEFSVSWPNFQDPFFLANPGENTARYTYYQVQGAPTLFAGGVKLADAVDPDRLRAEVDAQLQGDPGVLVDVAADPSQPTIPVTVTLTPLRDLDLTDHVLFVALYEDVVTVTPAPGSNGQTEFHHVFRDRVDTPPALGPLSAGVTQEFQVSLQRGDRDPQALVVVAFIQHSSARTVVQAGSTALEGHTP